MSAVALETLDRYLKTKRFEDAIDYCDRVLESAPDNALVIAIKGWCVFELGQAVLAEPLMLRAVELAPSHSQTISFSLSFFMKVTDYQKVIKLSQRCIELTPHDETLWRRLGTAHHLLGEYTLAVEAFKHALAIKDSPITKFSMSLPLLGLGDYEAGFNYYEHRFLANPKIDWLQSEKLPMPRWAGQPIAGKSILIWSEQGLGDTIQFSRLMMLLSAQGATVDLILSASHAGLVGVMETVDGINEVIVVTDNVISLTRRYDFHSPLMSLLGHLTIRPNNIPIQEPYLFAPSQARPINIEHSTDTPKRRIAIVWSSVANNKLLQSDSMHFNEKSRKSIPLELFEDLFSIVGHQFFSLNLNISEAENHLLAKHQVINLASNINTFSDTASFIEQMDLVVSIDTAVAHLAGAMGKPVINLLPYVSDWRWQNNQNSSEWYPSMSLCQQTEAGSWQGVVDQIKRRISDLFG